MAYSVNNPPRQITDSIGGDGTGWLYKSADTAATVNGASYFSNGVSLGMKIGDPVWVIDTTTPKTSFCFVLSVNTTTGAASTAFGGVA